MLTPKQSAFVNNLSKGMTKQNSAILAGYSRKSANTIASGLMKKTEIIKALDKHGLTDNYVANKLKENIDKGSGVKATADTALRAIEIVNDLKGYTNKSDNTTNNTQTNIYINELNNMSTDDLKAELQRLKDSK